MIDLKDARGKARLFCDLAFELPAQGKTSAQKSYSNRGAIIKAAQARSVVALRSVGKRKS